MERNREWPLDFKDGMAVMEGGRPAHVVAVPRAVVPAGHVPIMYDDEEGCFVTTPAENLKRRFF